MNSTTKCSADSIYDSSLVSKLSRKAFYKVAVKQMLKLPTQLTWGQVCKNKFGRGLGLGALCEMNLALLVLWLLKFWKIRTLCNRNNICCLMVGHYSNVVYKVSSILKCYLRTARLIIIGTEIQIGNGRSILFSSSLECYQKSLRQSELVNYSNW